MNLTRTHIAILALVSALLLMARPTLAADCSTPRAADGGMSEPVYRAVEQATTALAESKYNDAIGKLSKMVDGDITPYERAIVYYNLGYAQSLKGDNGSAVAAFQKAIDANALPQQQHEQLLYNTGQLYVLEKQLDKGITTLERYFAEACGKISPDAHVFLASAYAEKKRYPQALAQIDKAIALADKPKENWLQTKLAIHYELKQYQACADTLVRMIGLTPTKPDYWKQLSSMFLELKDDPRAVATLVLAERQGFVQKPNEIKNLYAMYMMLEVPYKAGQLYEDAISKGRIPNDETTLDALANAWINARELPKAEKVLNQLATSTGKGDYYFKLGAMYGDNERWAESAKMLEEANRRGGVKRPGELWLRLAMAYYSQQKVADARGALQKAMNYDETRRQASEWLQYLRQEAPA